MYVNNPLVPATLVPMMTQADAWLRFVVAWIEYVEPGVPLQRICAEGSPTILTDNIVGGATGPEFTGQTNGPPKLPDAAYVISAIVVEPLGPLYKTCAPFPGLPEAT